MNLQRHSRLLCCLAFTLLASCDQGLESDTRSDDKQDNGASTYDVLPGTWEMTILPEENPLGLTEINALLGFGSRNELTQSGSLHASVSLGLLPNPGPEGGVLSLGEFHGGWIEAATGDGLYNFEIKRFLHRPSDGSHFGYTNARAELQVSADLLSFEGFVIFNEQDTQQQNVGLPPLRADIRGERFAPSPPPSAE